MTNHKLLDLAFSAGYAARKDHQPCDPGEHAGEMREMWVEGWSVADNEEIDRALSNAMRQSGNCDESS